jgi:hypothetical protein
MTDTAASFHGAPLCSLDWIQSLLFIAFPDYAGFLALTCTTSSMVMNLPITYSIFESEGKPPTGEPMGGAFGFNPRIPVVGK